MTIRDVTSKGPSIIYGDGLQKMFDLRVSVQELFIKKEKLPPYPLDINTRASQSVLKGFFYNIFEELGEAYTEYLAMWPVVSNNDTQTNVMDLLMKYNEELADVHNFIMQLLLYCNITPDSIGSYYEKCLEQWGLKEAYFVEKDLLATCFTVAQEENLRLQTAFGMYYNTYQVGRDTPETALTSAGWKISPQLLIDHSVKLWDIVHKMTLAGNLLKNKPWRETDTYTEGIKFQAAIVEVWVAWVHYLSFIGMTPANLFSLYWKKIQVNLDRIKNKY